MQPRTKLLAEALRSLTLSKNGRNEPHNAGFTSTQTAPFYFCNEPTFGQSIAFLENARAIKDDKRIRLALLIGESNFISMLPEMSRHVDMVIMVDNDKRLLTFTQFLADTMRAQADSEQFVIAYGSDDNPIIRHHWPTSLTETSATGQTKVLGNKRKEANASLYLNSEILPHHHFISNDGRYDECREALLKMPIVHLELDILSSHDIDALTRALTQHNTIITISNLTNMFDYDANYPARVFYRIPDVAWMPRNILMTQMKKLPLHESAIILYSILSFQHDCRCLASHQVTELASYEVKMKEYTRDFNLHHRYELSDIENQSNLLLLNDFTHMHLGAKIGFFARFRKPKNNYVLDAILPLENDTENVVQKRLRQCQISFTLFPAILPNYLVVEDINGVGARAIADRLP